MKTQEKPEKKESVSCPRCRTEMESRRTTARDHSHYCPRCRTLICNGKIIRG